MTVVVPDSELVMRWLSTRCTPPTPAPATSVNGAYGHGLSGGPGRDQELLITPARAGFDRTFSSSPTAVATYTASLENAGADHSFVNAERIAQGTERHGEELEGCAAVTGEIVVLEPEEVIAARDTVAVPSLRLKASGLSPPPRNILSIWPRRSPGARRWARHRFSHRRQRQTASCPALGLVLNL